MNIDLLSQMVYDLILENDSLSLPGVGYFVAEMVPATFTDRGYTINPPYRKLSFRRNGQPDTLLVDLYAASCNVGRDTAEKVIVDFLAELKSVLFTKKTVVFPGLGRLRATRENNIFFVADENLDIFPEGFSLEPLSLKARKENTEEIRRSVEKLDEILNGPEPVEPESAPVEPESVEPAPVEPETVDPEPVEPVPADPAQTESETSGTDAQEPTKVSKTRRIWRGIGITAAVLTAVAAVLLGGFIVLAHTNPAFVDSLLYTQEELMIINWKL